MTNAKKLKQLLEACKTNEKLDAGKLERVVSLLRRNDLKEFLFLLKRERMSERIIVETPIELDTSILAMLKKIFKDKEIVIGRRKKLIGGMRLYMLDAVLDLSIQGALAKIETKI